MSDDTCIAPHCTAPRSNGYLRCRPHHYRWTKYRSHELPPPPTAADRFWAKVNKTSSCWLWTGAKMDRGYGQLWFEGRTWYAHRLSYEWAHGEIGTAQIDHVCHNRACVNPDHLRPVTNKQNQENAGESKNNTSGARGVTERGGKWEAKVTHHGRTYWAGRFSVLEDAAEAARAKRLELFTHNDVDRREETDHGVA